MKLKDIKNDGLFEKKKCEGCGGAYTWDDKRLKGKRDCCPDGKAYDKILNQAKTELSEVEVRVDEEKIEKVIWQTINKEFQYVSNPQIIECAKALSSSMSEWLELRKGEK